MKHLSLKDLNPSPEELKHIVKLLAQKRDIKYYENMSDGKLLNALKTSKNKNKTRIEKIRGEFKKLDHKLSRQE